VLRSVPQPRRCSLWPKSHQHLRRPWILLFGWAVTDMSVRPCWLTVLFWPSRSRSLDSAHRP
jgi:hypothetical protein